MSARVAEPGGEGASAEQIALIEKVKAKRGRLLMPYRIWLHSAGVGHAMEDLGTFLNTGSTLSAAERELVTLATVAQNRSAFATANHSRHARAAGLSEAVCESLREGRPAVLDDARLQAVADLTRAALGGATLSDVEFDCCCAALGREGIAEVLALVGYYTAVACALRLHDVQPPPT